MEKPIYLNTFKNDGNGPEWKNGKCVISETIPAGTYDVSIWAKKSKDGNTEMKQITIKDEFKPEAKSAPEPDIDDIPLS